MGNVLIATLGKGEPGAVTTSIDVLVRHQREVNEAQRDFKLDKLIVLMTPQGPNNRSGNYTHTLREKDELFVSDTNRIRAEYFDITKDLSYNNHYQNENGLLGDSFIVEPCVLNVAYDDIYNEWESIDFFRLCLLQIFKHFEENQVFIAYTGGRKTMAALALTAGIMTNLARNCFQAVVMDELGWPGGDIESDKWNEAMHPENAWYLASSQVIGKKSAECTFANKLLKMEDELRKEAQRGGWEEIYKREPVFDDN